MDTQIQSFQIRFDPLSYEVLNLTGASSLKLDTGHLLFM